MIIYKQDKVHDFTKFAHVIKIKKEYFCFMSTEEFIKYIMDHKGYMKILK